MSPKICAAFAVALATSLPLRASADDSQRLLSEVRFTTIKSFKLDMAYRSPRGEFDKNLTFVAPDRMRLEIPKQKLVAVTIGKFVWLRDPQNKWHKEDLPAGRDPMGAVHSLTALAKTVKNKTVTYVGDENIAGEKTHVYRLQALPRRGFTGISEKLWLGIDGYPRKIEQKNGPYSMLATYSDFNAPLSVAGP